jgi:hypothetical protein
LGSFSWQDVDKTIINRDDGDIEGTTTEVKDERKALSSFFLVETVGEGGSGRLVDNSLDIEASNFSSVLDSLSLGIVEICGDSNDDVFNRLSEEFFGKVLHLGQQHSGELFSWTFLFFTHVLNVNEGLIVLSSFELEGPVLVLIMGVDVSQWVTHKTFDIVDSVGEVFGSLSEGSISDEVLSSSECNVRRDGVKTDFTRDDFDFAFNHDGSAAIWASEINSDSLGHLI